MNILIFCNSYLIVPGSQVDTYVPFNCKQFRSQTSINPIPGLVIALFPACTVLIYLFLVRRPAGSINEISLKSYRIYAEQLKSVYSFIIYSTTT